MATYQLEFYEDANGDSPVRRWFTEELSRAQRFALGQAMREQLQAKGVGVCGTAFGKQLLLMGGYDKGADPSPRRQNDEIAIARNRLADWRRHGRPRGT